MKVPDKSAGKKQDMEESKCVVMPGNCDAEADFLTF